MDERPVSYRTCQACCARLLWVLTVNDRRMPLDAKPTTDGTGNVLIEHLPNGTIRGRVLTGAEMPAPGAAYVPHHRTCPAAAEYRRRTDVTVPRCARLDCRQPLDGWLVDRGYTRHIGCLPVSPEVKEWLTRSATPEPEPAPVVHEQGELFDLGGGAA